MTNLSDFSNTLADSVETASCSLVTVQAERPVSGTVIGEGLILTVAHVLQSDEVNITTPEGRTLNATVAGRDPASDLALLKVEGLNLPALTASAGVRVGELLLAVGRPDQTPQVALGLYTQPARNGWVDSGAAPFRGVTGGALLDARGGLVGILNAGISRIKAARGPEGRDRRPVKSPLLAVPVERALKVAGLLGSEGRVPRGYLGIGTQPVRLPGNPAQPRLEEGAHKQQGSSPEAGDEGSERGPEQRGTGPRQRAFGAQFGPRQQDFQERGSRWETWAGRGDPRHHDPHRDGPMRGRGHGWRQEHWHQAAHAEHPLGQGRLGLIVVQIEEGSPAQAAGLKVGDILLSLGGEALRHPRELLEQIRTQAGQTLSARILRSGEEQNIELSIGEH